MPPLSLQYFDFLRPHEDKWSYLNKLDGTLLKTPENSPSGLREPINTKRDSHFNGS